MCACVRVFKIHFNGRESRRETEGGRGVRGLDDEKRERDSGRQRGQTSAAPYRRTVRVRARVCVLSHCHRMSPLYFQRKRCVCTRLRVCVRVPLPSPQVKAPLKTSVEARACQCMRVCVCCSNIVSSGRLKKRGGARGGIRRGPEGRGQRLPT